MIHTPKNVCPVRSGPAPIAGSNLPRSEWPDYHDCSGKPGHSGKHSCGCGYEWSDLGEIPKY